MHACPNCPAVPADEGFLKEAPGGGLRSDSGPVSRSEGPFVLPPPETGSLELKGFVSSQDDLPEHPRPGWLVFADAEGEYAGTVLEVGDALVCVGTNPAVWLPVSGGGRGEIDAARLVGTASVDTTGSAGSVAHGLSFSGSGGELRFDGSADVEMSAGSGLSLSVLAGSVSVSMLPSGVEPGTYNAVTVGADGRVSLGSNPVTLAGHGIQDAYTKSEIDSRLTSGMHYRGNVPSYADLPSQDNVAGDFYNCVDTGNNYAWDGTEWDFVGNIIDFVPITNEAIDDITEH